jgi:hypothetical protein
MRCSRVRTSAPRSIGAGAMAGPYLLGIVGEYFGYGPLFIVSGAIAWVSAAYFVVMEPQSVRSLMVDNL